MILEMLASSAWSNIVSALLHTLWQGGMIALLLGLALRRLSHPVLRYRCALAALAGVLFAGLVTWAVLNRPPAVSPPGVSVSVTSSYAPPAPASKLPPLVVALAPPEVKAAPASWSAWLAMFWLAGATMMLFRAGFQVAGAEHLRRSARPLDDQHLAGLLEEARRAVGLARRVRLSVTGQLTSPAVVGVLVPTLILPLSLTTSLTPEQIRFILLHELAHIRRGDYLASLFQLFTEALLFFNPAVWWISRQMRNEREACCDALAVELSGAPVDYARTLVRVAENVLAPATAALAFGEKRGPSSLADRVQRMLVPGYRPALRLTWRAMLAALFVGSGLLFLSALGTRATVAAMLSPQARIERIEKKMAELGEKPETSNFYSNDETPPMVQLSGTIRAADGTPLPKWVWLNLNSSLKHSSYGTSIGAKNGHFTNSIRQGTIYIGAEVTNFAPGFIGPLDGLVTNHLENLEILLQRGFDVPLQLLDAENGKPVMAAHVVTMYWMQNNGFQPHAWQSGPDGIVALTHCADLPLDVTVSRPGYETTKKRFEHLRAGEALQVELRHGGIVSGRVLDAVTGQPVAGAELHLLYETDLGHLEWNDPLHLLGKTDAAGAFTVNQLCSGAPSFLGVSAPGHASTILDIIPGKTSNLEVRLGPELIVRGQVIGSLAGLQIIDRNYCLARNFSEKFDDHSFGFQEWVRVQVTNGVTTFQFTNRAAGPATLTSQGGYREEREVVAPVADWVVNLDEARKTEAKFVPKREVVFRFQHPSGVPPCGTVEVSIPDCLEINHLTAHMQEMQITNGEVHVPIAIGGRTSIEPKHMIGYWFNRSGNWTSPTGEHGDWLSIEVMNGPGPLVLDIPLIPAGAIYAAACNADGTPAGGVFFGVTELKRAPGRDQNSLEMGDNYSSPAPRHWVSGPLPLGGKYQIHAWRENAFCVSAPVTLTEANPDAEVKLQFAPGKAFIGVVLNPDGRPVPAAELKVSFKLPDGHGFGLKSVSTDRRGRFQLADLTPDLGEYTIEPMVPEKMDELVKLDFAAQPQLIHLRPGRSLGGRVVEAGTGLAITGVEVRALDFDRNQLPMLTTRTDENGRFAFSTLGEVNYTLYVEDGQLLSEKKFRADGNTNILLTVKLYGWSKAKPKAIFTGSAKPDADKLSSSNSPTVQAALAQRSGVEKLSEPEALTRIGRGIHGMTVTNISGALTNAKAVSESQIMATNVSLGRQAIMQSLRTIHLNQIAFGTMPLSEILRILSQEARQQDPSHQGINFLINSGPEMVANMDPLTGLSLVTNAAPIADLGSLRIPLSQTLTNVCLGDVLDALLLAAPTPIHYSVQDYAVVFSPGKAPMPLFARTFHVDAGKLLSIFERLHGVDVPHAPGSPSILPLTTLAHDYFREQGVDWESPPGKAIFFNDGKSRLYVRATERDLDLVEHKLSDFNKLTNISGVLSNSEFAAVLHALQLRGGAETLTEPEITTYSIRQINTISPREFLQAQKQAAASAIASALVSRTFHVDKAIFIDHAKVMARAMPNGQGTNVAQFMPTLARSCFEKAGIHLDGAAGKTVSYSEDTGLLWVKATKAEMAVIEQVMADITSPPAQIHIKARFYEVPDGIFQRVVAPHLLTNISLSLPKGETNAHAGFMTEKNLRTIVAALAATRKVEDLGEPEVTTISGRQTQMRATQTITVINTTNLANYESSSNNVISGHSTNSVEIGPILDVVPYILADGMTVNLAAIPSVTGFLGYHSSTNRAANRNNGNPMVTVLPTFTVRQIVTDLNIWDDQTIVLSEMPETTSDLNKVDNRHAAASELLIFISATIVDSAGNRVHTSDELPFAKDSIPILLPSVK